MYVRPLKTRCSWPSASSVPTAVGVKKAGIPAPPARMRSASVPCGVSSAMIRPCCWSSSTGERREGRVAAVKEAMTLRTRPSSTRPAPPAPFAMRVRSFAPLSCSARIRFAGEPTPPKPAMRILAPSDRSLRASSNVSKTFCCMCVPFRGCAAVPPSEALDRQHLQIVANDERGLGDGAYLLDRPAWSDLDHAERLTGRLEHADVGDDELDDPRRGDGQGALAQQTRLTIQRVLHAQEHAFGGGRYVHGAADAATDRTRELPLREIALPR